MGNICMKSSEKRSKNALRLVRMLGIKDLKAFGGGIMVRMLIKI